METEFIYFLILIQPHIFTNQSSFVYCCNVCSCKLKSL